jgi:tetratricopeptide (TPR) repeat protein
MSEILSNTLITKYKYAIIFGLALILYGNTLTNGFVLDDSIVITENDFTKKGFSGIWEILTTDSFHGFFKDGNKKNLVSGGRYRPLSVVLFAAEYEIFGKSAFWGHFFNILWFGLLCAVILRTLTLLFKNLPQGDVLALVATLLFTAHSVHTEAVANIKGRDEILSLLFSFGALYFTLLCHDEKKNLYLIYAGISMFLGLLSKEITITFLAVIPLALYLFRYETVSTIIKSSVAILIPSAIFLIIRQSILGNSLGEESTELMNNPFLKWNGERYLPFTSSERLATIMYTWLIYLKLLIWPAVLTHDYYPKHIELMQLGDWKVMVSFLIHLSLVLIAFIGFKKNKVISFGILMYFMTFSIISNLFFPIGTFMAERFLFTPSAAFSVLSGFMIIKAEQKSKWLSVALFGFFFLFFSIKTVERNPVWKDNHTLFLTDVKYSPNSAKLLNAAAGSTIDLYKEEKDQNIKNKMMDEAIGYLNRALQIHPTFSGAELLAGNALFFKNDLQGAADKYRKILSSSPGDKNAKKNLAFTLRAMGKYAGETLNDLDKAMTCLKESFELEPEDLETARLLAVAHGMKGNHDEVIKLLEGYLKKDSNNANVLFNLSRAYAFKNDKVKEKEYFEKAISLDPNILKAK